VVATLLSVGLEQPIEVREGGSGTYTLVYGARRCLAALFNWCVLGKPKEPFIEARLVKGNEATLLHRAVIENIRKHQSVIDEAKVIQLSLNAGDTKEEVAEQLGMSLSTIENRLKLLELDPKTQHKIHDGSMSVKKAKAESNGHVEPSKPPIRKRREIEEAAEEFALDRPERKILEWVLGRSDDKS
jgi:ParB family chromosome partitioning protein